jgi:lysozyme
MISDFGVSVIAEFEKFVSRTYLDEGGKATIGYGHLIRPGEEFPDRGITEIEARELLRQDCRVAWNGAAATIQAWRLLNNYERDALTSWTFNLGVGNLASSTMAAYIDSARPPRDIAAQMIRWVLVNRRRSRGLVRRRHCEAVWYLGAPQAVVMALARKEWA